MLKFNRFWNKQRYLISPTGRFLLLMALSSGLVMAFFLVPSTAQLSPQPQSPTEEQSETQSSSEVGWEFLGSRELNQTSITEIKYEGQCPGTELISQEARFISSETPPAPGRRVVVRNVTRGVASDSYPYTDREYDEGKSSEPTRMAFGTSHSGKRLHVLEGENKFEYEIKERNRVIDSGSFSAVIEKQIDSRRRDATVSRESVCMNSSIPLNVCADIRNQTQHKCPNGRVLQTFVEPNNREISTFISNQTFTNMVYVMNGEIQRLSSGDNRTYRSNSLSIEFNPSCTTCSPTRTVNLQPGRRYKFRASQFNSGVVELVDFPNP